MALKRDIDRRGSRVKGTFFSVFISGAAPHGLARSELQHNSGVRLAASSCTSSHKFVGLGQDVIAITLGELK